MSHLVICGAIIGVAVFVGVTTGRWGALLPASACAVMMFMMMGSMGGPRDGSGTRQS